MGGGSTLPAGMPSGGDPSGDAVPGSPLWSPTRAAHHSNNSHSDDSSPQAVAAMDMERAMALVTGKQTSRKVRLHPRDPVLTHHPRGSVRLIAHITLC